MDNKIASVNKIVLMTNFRTMFPETISTINQINDNLSELGFKLLLLSSCTSPELKCMTVEIPFSLKDYSSLKLEFRNNLDCNEDLIKIDAEFNDDDSIDYELYKEGLLKCKLVAHQIARNLRPAFALFWSGTVPQSILFKGVFAEYSIPSYFVERGLLPESLIFDESGNGACSSMKKNIDLNLTPFNFEQIFEEVKSYFFINIIDKHEQPDYINGYDFLKQNNLTGKRIIIFLGHWDVASGVNSAKDFQSFFNSPHFINTEDAYKSLVKFILNNKEIALIFKPHPFDSRIYENDNNPRIIVDKKLNVRTLIEVADAVAVMSTTVQYEVLFYDKPLILLANSFLTGLNIGYEVNKPKDLEGTINQALNKKDFSGMQINAEKFIAHISYNFLIKLNSSNPFKRDLLGFFSNIADKYYLNHLEEISSNKLIAFFNDLKKIFIEYSIRLEVNELIIKAEKLINEHNLIEARILLTSILINLDQESIEAANNLAVVELMSGNNEIALDLLNQIITKDPLNPVALENLNSISHLT